MSGFGALALAAAIFLGDLTTLRTGFLFGTGAFDFADTGFATALEVLTLVFCDVLFGVAATLEIALEVTLSVTLGAIFALGFIAVLPGDFFVVSCVTAFAVEVGAADFAVADFTFFTAGVRGFADFFIAFAMESSTTKYLRWFALDYTDYAILYEVLFASYLALNLNPNG